MQHYDQIDYQALLMKSGIKYFQEEKFDLAVEEFTLATYAGALGTKNVSLYIYRGFAYLRLGKIKAALSDFIEAVKDVKMINEYYRSPGFIKNKTFLLDFKICLRDVEVKDIEEMQPADIMKAINHLYKQDPNENIIDLLEKCVDKESPLGEFLSKEKGFIKRIKRGLIEYKFRQKMNESQDYFHIQETYQNRAAEYFEHEFYDDAILDYNTLIARYNEDKLSKLYLAQYYVLRGITYYAKDEFEKTLSDFEHYENTVAGWSLFGNAAADFRGELRCKMHSCLGDVYRKRGKYGKAIIEYFEAGTRANERLEDLLNNLQKDHDLSGISAGKLFNVIYLGLPDKRNAYFNKSLVEGNPLGDLMWDEVLAWDKKFNCAYDMEKYTLNRICKHLQKNDRKFVWPVKMISVNTNSMFEMDKVKSIDDYTKKQNAVTYMEENGNEENFIKINKMRPYTYHCEL